MNANIRPSSKEALVWINLGNDQRSLKFSSGSIEEPVPCLGGFTAGVKNIEHYVNAV